MKKIALDHISEGMILAEDIYFKGNQPFLTVGTELNSKILADLKKKGLSAIFVAEPQKKPEENLGRTAEDIEVQKLSKTYTESVDTVKNLITDVRFGRNINSKKIKESSGEMLGQVFKKNNILGTLRLFQGKDDYTYTHSVNVAMISTMIGKWLQLKEEDIVNLASAGLLHDIGKAKMPDSILNKPEKLASWQFEKMKKHTVEGYKILKDDPGVTSEIALVSLNHHERYDGSGYPRGLKGTKIDLYSRIVAIADIFDAMTSNRAFRSKVSPFRAADEISVDVINTLDPEICLTFINNISTFFNGNTVRLSNEAVGEIIYVPQANPTRPIIKSGEEFYDLMVEKDLEVIDVLM